VHFAVAAALKKEEEAWLKQREGLTEEDERKTFIVLRTLYMRALAGQ